MDTWTRGGVCRRYPFVKFEESLKGKGVKNRKHGGVGFMAVLRLVFFCIGFPENRLDSVKRRKRQIINNQESTLIIADPRAKKKQNPTHQKIKKNKTKRRFAKSVWLYRCQREIPDFAPGPILQPSQTKSTWWGSCFQSHRSKDPRRSMSPGGDPFSATASLGRFLQEPNSFQGESGGSWESYIHINVNVWGRNLHLGQNCIW